MRGTRPLIVIKTDQNHIEVYAQGEESAVPSWLGPREPGSAMLRERTERVLDLVGAATQGRSLTVRWLPRLPDMHLIPRPDAPPRASAILTYVP